MSVTQPDTCPRDSQGHNTRDGRHCEACGKDLLPELPKGSRVDLPDNHWINRRAMGQQELGL